MRAYSLDLRERVLAALDQGMPRAVAVITFAISLATIKRWLARRRAGQSLGALTLNFLGRSRFERHGAPVTLVRAKRGDG
jgi:transposase